ncbi:hypothetical protein MFLAVUS_006883 [Mucor flavus]|uniref:Uncharacterized protein n=1 Tax=Mucor flavus TaxID=439312 RepID=A0ABP9Z2S4_9FUNG
MTFNVTNSITKRYAEMAWMKNLRNVRTFPERVTSPVSEQTIQIIDEAALQSINFKLKEDRVIKRKAFSRELEYSDRYQRKLKQKNREMAKGSAKISSPVQTEMQKLQAAYDALTSELEPKISKESTQRKAGTYERTKYLDVHLYLELRIEGIKRVQASELAAKRFWYSNATIYRCIAIRKYAAEYIVSGKITEGPQGNTRRESVPKFQRNVPAIQNELRNVIIPKAIENNALNAERYANEATSIECIRKKLIEWGFRFKREG